MMQNTLLLTVSKGTNDFLQGKSNQYYANLTNIITVQHDRYTPQVYEDWDSFFSNHNVTLHLLCNSVAIITILGKISKLSMLSARAVRDQIAFAPPKRKPFCNSANFALYYNVLTFTIRNCPSTRRPSVKLITQMFNF